MLGLVCPSFSLNSGSKSKISGRILKHFRGLFSSAENLFHGQPPYCRSCGEVAADTKAIRELNENDQNQCRPTERPALDYGLHARKASREPKENYQTHCKPTESQGSCSHYSLRGRGSRPKSVLYLLWPFVSNPASVATCIPCFSHPAPSKDRHGRVPDCSSGFEPSPPGERFSNERAEV